MVLPSFVFLRTLTDASTDLKNVLAKKIPAEQQRVKEFRKQHGATKVGEVTVDMVSYFHIALPPSNGFFLIYLSLKCLKIQYTRLLEFYLL